MRYLFISIAGIILLVFLLYFKMSEMCINQTLQSFQNLMSGFYCFLFIGILGTLFGTDDIRLGLPRILYLIVYSLMFAAGYWYAQVCSPLVLH